MFCVKHAMLPSAVQLYMNCKPARSNCVSHLRHVGGQTADKWAWKLVLQYLAMMTRGEFHGCCLAAAGSGASLCTLAARAGGVRKGLREACLFFRRLRLEFTRHVIDCHGHHVPRSVRDASCFLFCQPLHADKFPLDFQELTMMQLMLVQQSLSEAASYVWKQVKCFEVVSTENLWWQYEHLVAAWRGLLPRLPVPFTWQAADMW